MPLRRARRSAPRPLPAGGHGPRRAALGGGLLVTAGWARPRARRPAVLGLLEALRCLGTPDSAFARHILAPPAAALLGAPTPPQPWQNQPRRLSGCGVGLRALPPPRVGMRGAGLHSQAPPPQRPSLRPSLIPGCRTVGKEGEPLRTPHDRPAGAQPGTGAPHGGAAPAPCRRHRSACRAERAAAPAGSPPPRAPEGEAGAGAGGACLPVTWVGPSVAEGGRGGPQQGPRVHSGGGRGRAPRTSRRNGRELQSGAYKGPLTRGSRAAWSESPARWGPTPGKGMARLKARLLLLTHRFSSHFCPSGFFFFFFHF